MTEYKIRRIYDAHDLRIVEYTHNNGTKTIRAFYKGRSNNPQEIFQQINKYQDEIVDSFNKLNSREPNETLESYLKRTDDVKYVDNLGFKEGLILGAYVPSKDQSVILRNIPTELVQVINNIRESQLEQILGNESYKHPKTVSEYDIRKFTKAHEAAHRRRMYANESQDEREVDLEAAVITGKYPIIRYPEILKEMNDPQIKEEILKKEGIEYVRQAA